MKNRRTRSVEYFFIKQLQPYQRSRSTGDGEIGPEALPSQLCSSDADDRNATMIRLSVLWTSLNLIRIAALPWSTHYYTALPAARHTISSDVVSDSSSLRFTPHSQHLRSIDPLYNQLPGSPDFHPVRRKGS